MGREESDGVATLQSVRSSPSLHASNAYILASINGLPFACNPWSYLFDQLFILGQMYKSVSLWLNTLRAVKARINSLHI